MMLAKSRNNSASIKPFDSIIIPITANPNIETIKLIVLNKLSCELLISEEVIVR
jgi:hypothetical protein